MNFKGLALFWPNQYVVPVKTIDMVIAVQGRTKSFQMELWNSKGDSSQPNLSDVQLIANPLGNTVKGGNEIITNGYFKMRAGGSGAYTNMSSDVSYDIGAIASNGKVDLYFQVAVPEDAESLGVCGFWLNENGDSQNSRPDIYGGLSFGYDGSNNPVTFQDGRVGVLEEAGVYGGAFVDYNATKKTKFAILFRGLFVSPAEASRRENAGWVIN